MAAHTQNDNFAVLCREVETEMARLAVPDVVVGIQQGDNTSTAGFGVTGVENPLPVTLETLYQIGSITKTFLATAVMRHAQLHMQNGVGGVDPLLSAESLAGCGRR